MGLKAIVRAGRLVLDEPADLPEGTVLDLVIADEAGERGDEELRALDERLARAATSIREGRGVPADALLAKLRARAS